MIICPLLPNRERSFLDSRMSTDDCEVTLEALEAARIEVVRGPSEHAWGIEAPFVDPFGNEFVLFEYASG